MHSYMRSLKKKSSRLSSTSALKNFFSNIRKISLITHPNPDGDAMGSTLGFYHVLRELGYVPRVIVPNSFPEFLSFLPSSGKVVVANQKPELAGKILKDSELIVIMDFNSINRAENLKECLLNCQKPVLLLDHHQQPDIKPTFWFWDRNASSTCEMVYRFVKKIFPRYVFSRKSATCIYTGVVTDTGSFRYPSVTPFTHGMVQELLDTGIAHHKIHEAIFDDYSLNRYKLMALAIRKLTLCHHGKAAYIYLSQQELNQYGYKKGDTEGFSNLPLSIKGVVLSGFFMEQDKFIKISLRSKGNVDVNAMARKFFNGGGHKNAAGGKWFESIDDLIRVFTQKIQI